MLQIFKEYSSPAGIPAVDARVKINEPKCSKLHSWEEEFYEGTLSGIWPMMLVVSFALKPFKLGKLMQMLFNGEG